MVQTRSMPATPTMDIVVVPKKQKQPKTLVSIGDFPSATEYIQMLKSSSVVVKPDKPEEFRLRTF